MKTYVNLKYRFKDRNNAEYIINDNSKILEVKTVKKFKYQGETITNKALDKLAIKERVEKTGKAVNTVRTSITRRTHQSRPKPMQE